MSRFAKATVFVAQLLIFGATLRAQLNLATVLGTIKDTSGAVVPNATVTIRNLGTGLERPVTTDSSGDYTITNLAVGHYSLTVSLSGFKTTTIPDFELQVGQSARIDAILQVGSTTQEVTVSTTPPLLAPAIPT